MLATAVLFNLSEKFIDEKRCQGDHHPRFEKIAMAPEEESHGRGFPHKPEKSRQTHQPQIRKDAPENIMGGRLGFFQEVSGIIQYDLGEIAKAGTGQGAVLVPGQTGGAATGMKVDRRNRLFVSGASVRCSDPRART